MWFNNSLLSLTALALLACAAAKPLPTTSKTVLAPSTTPSPVTFVDGSPPSSSDITSTESTDSTSSPTSSLIYPATSTLLTTGSSSLANGTSSTEASPSPPLRSIITVVVISVIIVGGTLFCIVMRHFNQRKLAEAEKSGRRVTKYFQRPQSVFARPSSLFRPHSVAIADNASVKSSQPRPRMSLFRGNEGGRFSFWLGGRDNASKQSLDHISITKSNAGDDSELVPPMPSFAVESRKDQEHKLRSKEPTHYDKF